MPKLIFLAASLLLSFTALADTPSDKIIVKNIVDKFDPNVTVSGQVRSGVMRNGPQ